MKPDSESDVPDERAHPGEETWEQFACGELEAVEHACLLDHLVVCPDCAAVAEALRRLTEEARGFDPEIPAAPFRRRSARTGRVRFSWPATAAAAVVIAALGWGVPRLVQVAPDAKSDTVRASPQRSLRLGGPLGVVETAPTELTWLPLAGARQYRLELYDHEAEPLWNGVVSEPRADWPQGLTNQPGGYFWRVVARLESGDEVASELGAFEIVGR